MSTKDNATTYIGKENARAIVKRMMKAFGFEKSSHAELAKRCDVHERTPSNWIQQGNVSPSAIIACHCQTGVSLDWLYHGAIKETNTSPAQLQQYQIEVAALLESSKKMKLIAELKTGGFGHLCEGLTACFIEARNTEPDE